MPANAGASGATSDGATDASGRTDGWGDCRGLRDSQPHGLRAFADDATLWLAGSPAGRATNLLSGSGTNRAAAHGLYRTPIWERLYLTESFFAQICRRITIDRHIPSEPRRMGRCQKDGRFICHTLAANRHAERVDPGRSCYPFQPFDGQLSERRIADRTIRTHKRRRRSYVNNPGVP